MINSIGNALKALQRAEDRYSQSAERISKGDISAEALIESKQNATDVKVQAKNLAIQSKLEDQVLDILA